MNNDKPALLEDVVVRNIAKRHGKIPAQILLRFGIERNTVVIPKSTSSEHLKENAQIFDFELSANDSSELAKLERGLRYVDPYEWWKIPYFE